MIYWGTGQSLICLAHFSDFNNLQMYLKMFGGGITCIGYLAKDSKNGYALNPGDAYAITVKAEHKEGVWEFIESVLSREEDGRYQNGFLTRKSELGKMIEEAMKAEECE